MPAAFERRPPPEASRLALLGWNILGGMEWPGLPFVIEMLDIQDVEAFVMQLVAIRNWQNRRQRTD